MKKALAAGGVTLSLLTTSCGTPEDAVTTQFNEVQQFWDGRVIHLGAESYRLSMSSVKLEYIKKNDIARCHDQPKFGLDKHVADYCMKSNGVQISEAFAREWYKKQPFGGDFRPDPTDVLALVMQHEEGHAVTDVMGIMPWNDGKRAELAADCLAGEAARHLRPDRVDKEEQALQYAIGSDPYHGTTEQRVNAFMHGAKIGSCTSYLIRLPH